MNDEVYFPNEVWKNIKTFVIPDEDESETRDRLDVYEVCGSKWRGSRLTLCMAGGSSRWWNYVLYYTDDECSYDLFLESKDGMVRLYGRKLIYSLEDPGIEYVKEVWGDFEPKYSSNLHYCDPEGRQECTIEDY